MWVESAAGRGARFSFRLPGAHSAQPELVTEPRQQGSGHSVS